MVEEIVQIQEVKGHEDKVWSVEWHQSGKFLATASSDKLIKIWGEGNAGGTAV